MKKYEKYVYTGGEDLNLDGDGEEIEEVVKEVPEELHPTEEMLDNFHRNCEEMGYLKKFTIQLIVNNFIKN